VSKHLNLTNPTFKFYYLSLGKSPQSPEFELLPYSTLAKCINVRQNNSKPLNLLLSELKSRIDEYYTWPVPKEEDCVLEYLKNYRGFVNFDKTFENVVKNLIQYDNLNLDVGVTSNRGCGYIPLSIWQKDNWQSDKYPAQTDGSKCYDIHFELQWNTCNDSIYLRLDYHTNPYMSKKELAETLTVFSDKFRDKKKDFFDHVKRKNSPLWRIKNNPLSVADFIFKNDVQFGELKQKINELIGNMAVVVDEYLE